MQVPDGSGGVTDELCKRAKLPETAAWSTHDRFGMFIQVGLYAMPARHEWVKTNEKISEEHYDLYFKYFNTRSAMIPGIGQDRQKRPA